MAGSVLGNRTRNFVLRLVVNGCKFTQSEVPNSTALPLVIEKLRKKAASPFQSFLWRYYLNSSRIKNGTGSLGLHTEPQLGCPPFFYQPRRFDLTHLNHLSTT